MDDGWLKHAACRGTVTADFYPDRGDRVTDAQVTDRAKQVCAGCPVRLPCLDQSMEEPYGVWGGWTGTSRTDVRRLGHVCPWCEVRLPRMHPRMFCDDECLIAAAGSSGEFRADLEDRLEGMVAGAAEWNRDRKKRIVAAIAAHKLIAYEQLRLAVSGTTVCLGPKRVVPEPGKDRKVPARVADVPLPFA